MSHSFAVEILHISEKLEKVGFTREQAHTQAEILADIIDDKLASKRDILDVKKDLMLQIAESKKDLELKILESRKDLELKIAESKTEIIKWMLGVCTAQAAIIISCIKFIH